MRGFSGSRSCTSNTNWNCAAKTSSCRCSKGDRRTTGDGCSVGCSGGSADESSSSGEVSGVDPWDLWDCAETNGENAGSADKVAAGISTEIVDVDAAG